MSIPASTSQKISFTSLDYDAINLNIQNYLQNQNVFNTYNFQGSGLQVLLSILSYQTMYLAYYLNFVGNEMFLDSADRRQNVVSRAKEIGYTPASSVSATAVINFTITPPLTPTPPSVIVVPQYTVFTTSVNGINYNFVTLEAFSLNYNAGTNSYTATNITISEGIPYTFQYIVNLALQPPQLYMIPNSGVDINTVQVQVQQSSESLLLTNFSYWSNFNTLNSMSTVYFLQEDANELYEVYFGDGVLGQALQDGNVVFISYLNCNADAPNYANVFTPASPIAGFGNIVVTTVSAASGGAQRESIDSIRFSAPLNYQAQNRAVTVQDYKTLIYQAFPYISSVTVFGGENQIPPQYGKVFISVEPLPGYFLTNSGQTNISNFLQNLNVLTVIPEFVNPDYTFLIINSLVKYNAQNTANSSGAIQAEVISVISNFASTYLNQFDLTFMYSKLTSLIDGADPSITNDLTTVQVQKQFVPIVGISNQYILNFYNGVQPNSVSSSAFIDSTYDLNYVSGDEYYFNDDGNGNIREYKLFNNIQTYVNNNIGTIDYTTGQIIINNFSPQSFSGTYISLNATPQVNDVIPQVNNILVISPSNVTVTMQVNAPLNT